MELTAGKLRAAGWLIILVAAMAIATIVLVTLTKSGPTGAALTSPLDLWIKAYLLGSAASVVYLLLVFRLLLNQQFSFARLDTTISSLVILYILYTALKVFLPPSITALWPKYAQLILGLAMMVMALDMSIALLRGPADLFGYRKKLAVSSLISFACYSVIIVTAAVVLLLNLFSLPGPEVLLGSLYILTLLGMIGGFGASIFFAVVLIRMFFAAARAMEADRPPEALAAG